jgi:hypothetical protein
MSSPFWLSLADAAQKWASVAAIVVGGIWAFYRFGLRREREPALGIDLSFTTVPYNSTSYLVAFDLTLANKGSVRLRAKRKRSPAYSDKDEALKYSCDLMLRAVSTTLQPGSQVTWFSALDQRSPREGDIELDLISEHELDGDTDFWMEPNETYHVGTALILQAGIYLVMVTFVGDASDGDFWRRLFVIQVPQLPDAASGSVGKP